MQVIACIEPKDVAKKILVHLGLPSELLPTARAKAHGPAKAKAKEPVRTCRAADRRSSADILVVTRRKS